MDNEDANPPESAGSAETGPATIDPDQVSDDDLIVSLDEDGDEFFAILAEVGVTGKRSFGRIAAVLLALLLLGAGGAALAWHFTKAKPQSAGLESAGEEKQLEPAKKTHEQEVVEQTPAAMKQRRESLRLKAALEHGGSEETEKAVRSALEFLARTASEDGSWDSKKFGASGRVDLAMTGLALLAFAGAGQTAKEGDFRETVKKAASFVVSNQDPKTGRIWKADQGGFGVGYTHSICGLALVELAALDREEAITASARKAVDYSIGDHPYQKNGKPWGWRYNARQWPDTSVTGWFVMQLKSAPEAGIEVPREAMTGAAEFLEQVRSREKIGDTNDILHMYGYDSRSNISPRRSAIACLCRLYIDISPGEMLPSIDYIIRKKPPKWEEQDWYYWYYAMMLTFQVDKERFLVFNKALRDEIVKSQSREGELAGSWAPGGEHKEWGRLLSTTLATLCLEVYYRYTPVESQNGKGIR